ncbi:acyltransferase [Leptospira gomenensis]|uniref:Acyltransferase n=1 Tax=Leptospira gomenensis TaxID=2484974 RepID=A0A5F1Y6F2_9LEPT|nr:acyltransferase [Leptospira gomenensis]TGK28801.1 acyltransferase [Leptospira gomenensis]TGK42612.1 acyltransferase [Leptospira gomenensis]TGK55860.1 acyltransferase [Leptospira gomenensis]
MLNAIKDLFRPRESELKPLNGLRALAIIFVVLNHYVIGIIDKVALPESLKTIYLNLWSGVDLFFVLSGFLISKGLWENWRKELKINFGSFYIKRTLRIFPAYYFFLIVTYLVGKTMLTVLEKKGTYGEIESLKQILTNSWGDFLFLGNYIQGINTHTWSLSSEEQFYLIFPILCSVLFFRLGFKLRQLILWIVYIVPLACRIVTLYAIEGYSTPPYFKEIYYPFQTRFDSLIIGVIVMDFYMNRPSLGKFIEKYRIAYISSIALFFSFVIICHLISQDTGLFFAHTFKYNFLNIGYAGILYLSIIKLESPLSKFLSSKILTPIARLSYTIYLWHFILMGTAVMLLKIKPDMSLTMFHLKFFGMVIILIVLSLPLYLTIEVPFQKLRNRLRLNGSK